MTNYLIFKFLFIQYRGHILFIVFLYAIEMACRLGFSVILQILFENISEELDAAAKTRTYLIVTGCGVLWFVGQMARHNAFYETPIIAGKIRSELVFLIYAKLSRISQYTAKSQ